MNTARWAGMSRRTVLGAGVGVAVGAAAGAGGVVMAGHSAQSSPGVVEFRGSHQAGIATAAQDRLHFAAFDVITEDRTELITLLRAWTAAAERMTRGLETEPDGAVGQGAYLPPSDTGEALNLSPSRLTLTIGFGPSLFGPDASDPTRSDRFGLATRRPAALTPLPAFVGDQLDPARCGGDICIQACSDDPQVAVHAVRNLARMGFGVVSVRWSQLGFGRTSSTSAAQETPRNMFGFKDGTANIKSEDTATSDRWVWVANSDNNDPDQRNSAAWMTGGSYLVARRIRMFLETWDRDRLSDQQNVFGRSKADGAPLTGHAEDDEPDYAALDATGSPLIPADAHIRLASPENNAGLRILRRGYSYTDGIDADTGTLDAGLFFIAFQNDPARFVTLQRRLGTQDALNEYIRHVGSGLFACPAGLTAPGERWGAALFA